MTSAQFTIFSSFRTEFHSYCQNINALFSETLRPLQIEASKKDTPEYPLETPVVYNTALDEITKESEIKLIVIGDNPGKDEQRAQNQKYLVGQSGKIAAGFFSKNTEFQTDFRKNAIILNKTPIHTAKTNHLKHLLKNGNTEIKKLISDSQIFMAQKTAQLHIDLCKNTDGGISPELWLVGYAELKNKGLFTEYRDTLKKTYEFSESEWEKVFVFQHFSMNRFSINLAEFMKENQNLSIIQAAHKLGMLHKNEIFQI